MKLFLSSFFLFFSGFLAFCQITNPPANKLFEDTAVPVIQVYLSPDSLNQLLNQANWYSDHEYPATVVITLANSNPDTIQNCGLRLRGNTSRNSAKKSFKISFNTFESGRRYKGVKKLNLNGEHNDPSVTRAKFYWDMSAQNQLAAPRSNHVRLYINNEYKGLYFNVEQINDDFLVTRFGEDAGNLYKCLYPADMANLGTNPNSYKLESGGRRVYTLETNTSTDDYADIANLINKLNTLPAASFPCQFEAIFDVNEYLYTLALDICTGNWDSYHYNKNNYYLYFSPEDHLAHFIAFDTDNILGIDWFNITWSTRNVYSWGKSGLPLYEKVMAVDRYKQILGFYINRISTQMGEDAQLSRALEQKNKLGPYVQIDNYYSLDYGYNFQDFQNAFTTAAGAHVKSGIVPFFNQRATSNNLQVNTQNIAPIVRKLNVLDNNPLIIRAYIEDENTEALTVKATYSFNGGGLSNEMNLYDDGMHYDNAPNDGWFGNTANVVQTNVTEITVSISATDEYNKTTEYPCVPTQGSFPFTYGQQNIINELMAKNNTVIADENGKYSDWVELYFKDGLDGNLNTYYLTDEKSNPRKWQLPSMTNIGPNSFFLVWMDDDTVANNFHASFKLSADGDNVYLYKADGPTNTILIDFINYGEQTKNISFGRSADGYDDWVLFQTPTPNSSNGRVNVAVPQLATSNNLVKVYPTLYAEQYTIQNISSDSQVITIYAADGKLLKQFILDSKSSMIMTDDFSTGMRFIHSRNVRTGNTKVSKAIKYN